LAVEFISGTGFSSATAQSGSQGSITIPADCTCIVVAASIENVATASGKKLTALNWDNSGYDPGTDFIGADGDTYAISGIELAAWNTNTSGWPGTGSGKTLYWTHVNAPDYATKFWVGFFKGVEQTGSPLNAVTWTATNDDDSTNITHTTALGTLASGDYGIIASYFWPDAGASPTTVNTELYKSSTTSANQLYVAGDVDDTSIVVAGSGFDYPISCAFSLKAAAAGGGLSIPIVQYYYRKQRN